METQIVSRSMPRYAIGSPPKLDWSEVSTGQITRAWARAIYKVQREALEWARALKMKNRPDADAEGSGTGTDIDIEPGPALPSTPVPFAPPDIPAELLPLLRPPGEWKRNGVAMPRFRYVYFCKRRQCYGFSVPPTNDKPRCNGSPFASDLEAAMALHRALGGEVPPTKAQRQKVTRAAVATQHHGQRAYGWGKTTNSKGVYKTTNGRFIGKFKLGNRTYNAGTYDSEGEASAAVAARRRDLAAGDGGKATP